MKDLGIKNCRLWTKEEHEIVVRVIKEKKCLLCNFKGTNVYLHVWSHFKIPFLVCPVCKVFFKVRGEFHRHIENVHIGKNNKKLLNEFSKIKNTVYDNEWQPNFKKYGVYAKNLKL